MKSKIIIKTIILVVVFLICGIIIRKHCTNSLQYIIEDCSFKTDFYYFWFMPYEEVHPSISLEEERKIRLECAFANYFDEIFCPIKYYVLKRGTLNDWLNWQYRIIDRSIYRENSSCNYASCIKSLLY